MQTRDAPMHLNQLAIAAVIALAGCGSGESDSLSSRLQIDPQNLDFGEVGVGSSKVRSARISNGSSKTIQIQAPVLDETLVQAGFRAEIDNLSPLPGSWAELKVTFEPTAPGGFSGSVNIANGDGDDSLKVPVLGTGVVAALEVTPQTLNFGSTVVNSTQSLTVTVRNPSSGTVRVLPGLLSNVQACQAGGTESFCFLVPSGLDADGGITLGGNGSVRLEVQFFAAVVGTRERGSLELKTCETPACSTTISMEGIGVGSGIACNPATLDFGVVNPGTCRTTGVTCANTANARVTISSWAMQANSSPAFSADPSRVLVLQQNERVSIEVSYCPTGGNDEGRLAISTDSNLGIIEVPLSGAGGGPDIQVSPGSLDFCLTSLIVPSHRTLRITNIGSSVLSVNEILVDTAGTGAFTAISGGGAQVIAPGDSAALVVEFQPAREVVVNSAIIIRSDDPDAPEVNVPLTGEGINLPPCSVDVSAAVLDFGSVEHLRSQSRALQVTNLGNTRCLLGNVELDAASDGAFSLPDPVVSRIIEPGAAVRVRVDLASEPGSAFVGTLNLSVSDPVNPVRSVPLTGVPAAEQAMVLTDSEIDFGVLGSACEARSQTVSVFNAGAQPMTLNDISLVSMTSAFGLTVPDALPVTLASGASRAFTVEFVQPQVGEFADAVRVSATYGQRPLTRFVSLLGSVDADPNHELRVFQSIPRETDVLFVIDNSCSMNQEQAAIANSFFEFFDYAELHNVQYQAGVTTTDILGNDGGKLEPLRGNAADRVITAASQPSPAMLFEQNALVGTSGSAQEQGMHAAYLALTEPNIGGHNIGLLRPEAALAVVVMSDEPDFSPNLVDFYEAVFVGSKGRRDRRRFSFNAIVGDSPGGCNGPNGGASSGTRYLQMVDRTDGQFVSICAPNLEPEMARISPSVFGLKSSFRIAEPAVAATVAVLVDGVAVPATSWSYDDAKQVVVFTASAIPEVGAEISVRYTAECRPWPHGACANLRRRREQSRRQPPHPPRSKTPGRAPGSPGRGV